jgi:hypothetical protein
MTLVRPSPLPPPNRGRRALLRFALAVGAVMASGCAGNSGLPPPRALNLKRDLSKENGASKR